MMAMYGQLLRKEWRQTRTTRIIFIGAGLLWTLFWLIQGPYLVHPFIADLLLSLGLALAPLWAVWQGYQSFRQEWSTDHAYLLLSLPVPGWFLVTTKLLVIWADILLYGAIVGGGALYMLFALPVAAESLASITNVPRVAQLLIFGLSASMAAALILQWSWLAGRLTARWHLLVETAGLFVACWAVLRGGILFGRLLGQWIPSVIFFSQVDWSQTAEIPGFQPSVILGNTGVILGVVVALALILLASVWLVEREVEL